MEAQQMNSQLNSIAHAISALPEACGVKTLINNSVDPTRGFSVGTKFGLVSGNGFTYYEVIKRDDLRLLMRNVVTVAAESSSALTNLTQLDPPQDIFYQVYRLEVVKGNLKYEIRQPAPTSRFGTEANPADGLITDTSDHALISMWCVNGEPPAFIATNDTNVQITGSLRAYGNAYQVRAIPPPMEGVGCYIVSAGGVCR